MLRSCPLFGWVVLVGGLTFLFGTAVGVDAEEPLCRASMGVELPGEHNTPDGMTLDGEGNILLSCPNFSSNKTGNELPAWIVKITPEDALEKFFRMPVHPETGKACPLGIAIAADGNLYVADCQAIGGAVDYQSRLLRVVIDGGKPVRCETVVDGFAFANAVACFGEDVYVTETTFEPEPGPGPIESGVYRFALSELSAERPIELERGGTDPHVAVKFVTKNETWKVGANGLGFAKDGTMYVCNFGDASLLAFTFDPKASGPIQRVVAQGGPMKSTDGLKVCPETGVVYIADFLGNAVHRVCPKSGKVTVLARNGPSDGAGGALDKCSEVCLRGNRLYVSNIDLDLDGNTFDAPHTISVIELPGG